MGKVSASMDTGAEAAEIAANRAEKSSRAAGKQPVQETTPEKNSDENIIVPGTPLRAAGKSQGGTIITLALRTLERLYIRPDLAPKVVLIYVSSL